jgi:hypothetical protein
MAAAECADCVRRLSMRGLSITRWTPSQMTVFTPAGSRSGSELIAKSHLDDFDQIMGDFINAIGPKRTGRGRRSMSAFGRTPDMRLPKCLSAYSITVYFAN